MQGQQAKDINAQLARSPIYQAALAGRWFAPGMPRTPGFRSEHLRAAARASGVNVGGRIDESGKWSDPNYDHPFFNPRVLGPLVVGAAAGAGGLGALGGAGGASASAAAPLTSTIPQGVMAAGTGVGSGAAATGGSMATGLGGAFSKGLGSTIGQALPYLVLSLFGKNKRPKLSQEESELMKVRTQLAQQNLSRQQMADPNYERLVNALFRLIPQAPKPPEATRTGPGPGPYGGRR